ncbi:CHAD domain-containing protein [Sphingobium sp. Sx8-8]|uniref:CYTH and CHAD domain-containing protein n=1 Tax=Sphingobium sp. Sx8-8 TaxID=2933617 RepID=UPI001F57B10F|nr:CHAD domain-containing protein [Sphingobium sp. Sx8-8]
MSREIELKLELAREAADAFAGLALLPGESEVADLRAVYFDTPQRDLAQRGVTLRIRRSGDRLVQTVKADGDGGAGLFARAEWEMPVAGDMPVLDARTPVAAMLGEAVETIEPVFHVDVERRTWIVSPPHAEIELVLDRGQVSAGERQAPVCEIELELKAGEPAALFHLARRIDGEIPVRLGVLPKSERGYRLRDAVSAAVKAEPVMLDASATVGEAFARIVSACMRHYRLNEALLFDHYEPRALHQARVAIRRLRSALSLFRPLLADADLARFQGELKWLAGMLGEARNLDVLAERIGAKELRQRLETVRTEAHERVGQWLQSARVRALMIDLAEWLALGAVRDEGPAADFAAKRLRKLHRRIAKEGSHLERLSDAARHEVRKDAKKLRYGSEFFAGLFAGRKQRRRQARFIAALEKMQEGLGTLNDLVSAPEILARHGLDGGDAVAVPPKKKRKLLSATAGAQETLAQARPFWT